MRLATKRQIKENQESVRKRIWPTLNVDHLWDVRDKDKTKGFISLPRTMPIIIQIMDDMAGFPVGMTYFELWSRSNDLCFVSLSKQEEIAFASGYTSSRGVRVWKGRLKKLHELGFIDLQPGPGAGYVLIWNPYLVIQNHREKGTSGIRTDLYNALVARAGDIGATDLDRYEPEVEQAAE